MRKLFYKISSLYNTYQWIMWISGILSSIILPLIPYLFHIVAVLKEKRTIMADDPELAGSLSPGSPLEYWFSGDAAQWGRYVSFVLLACSLLFLVCLLILQVLAWVDARTEVSGLDEEAVETERADRRAEKEDSADDYGDEE